MSATSPITLFDPSIAVFGAPSRYLQGAGALDRLGALAAGLGDRVILVTDATVLGLYGDQIRLSAENAQVGLEVLLLDGDLLPSTAKLLTKDLITKAGDVVVGCGGGRAIDSGKAVAELLGAPLITVPTVASNDAPTSKNFVIYDANHRIAGVRHLPRNPDFVLVDTAVLAAAPKQFMAAGFGDALAKRVEAEACSKGSGVNMFRAKPLRLACAIAAECENVLLTQGHAALDVAGTGRVTQEFEACVEALILMAGLAFESGGLSIAHALTRGLPLIEEIAPTQHGHQVAYGVMVQKMLEGGDIDPRMTSLMSQAELPISFRDLSGRVATPGDFVTIADGTMGVPHLDNHPTKITRDMLVSAMVAVEAR